MGAPTASLRRRTRRLIVGWLAGRGRSLTLLLDTTVLIDALRGRSAAERVRGLREEAHVPWVCTINVEEVVRGAADDEQRAVQTFLRGMRLAPLGWSEGELAGAWRRDFASRGVTLSQADCLIAAAALGVGARLATGNPKHFPMTELEVEHWPVGT
jgi:predicted nucleic acid-binding protein